VPQKPQVLFTFRLVPAINAMLARGGIDGVALVREAGLPLEGLRGEITAPLHRVQEFVAKSAARLDNECFGIDLAASLPGGAYGLPEFMVRASPEIGVGLRALCEFAALINPSGQFRFVDGPTEGELHYELAAEPQTLGLHLNEFTLAYIVRQTSMILERRLPLTRVWFSHPGPRRAEDVSAHFGCPVQFGASDCGFAVSAESLLVKPTSADPLLFKFLQDQARAQLARVGPVDIVSQLVRVLEGRLSSGAIATSAVARALAMTPRTLQRYLAEAGTTYGDVLAHVRRRRRAELSTGPATQTEIAHQLGFSDARAMRRSLGE
jgi:AraC-like DNA-binding protein